MTELSDIHAIAECCGRPKRYTRGWMCLCPCHEDRNPSCAVWYDGDRISVKCFAGCDSRDVADCLRAKGFVLSAREHNGYARRDLSKVVAAKRPATIHDNAVRTQQARDIWAESHRATGSPVADYLHNRGLDLGVVPFPDLTIRYHPHCPRGKLRQPAMISALRDISTDRIIAIHRTYLKNGRKDGTPMMLGPCFETAIKLSPHTEMFAGGRTFVHRLHVAEGVETAIACLMLKYKPVWALGSAGAIAAFGPQLQIGELIVMADHDRPILDARGLLWCPGESAASACVKAWRSAGWRARYEMPEQEGDDYADVAERIHTRT